MLGPLFAFFLGAVTLGVAAFIFARRQSRRDDLVPMRMRAVGVEERRERDDLETDTYYHIVYELVDGPDAGRHVVSELGHGGVPRLPEGECTELVRLSTAQVFTRGAMRLEAAMIFVFGTAGAIAIGAAVLLASRS